MTGTISKGTLNLRFMQNARRAEQKFEVESVETIVNNDDSYWEVSREVKDMWGITSEPSSSSLVTHEASYIPFVLSDADASGSPAQPVKLRGRRTWNKRGQEVTEEVEILLDDNKNKNSTQHHHHPVSKRLTSISSFGPGSSSTKETKRAKSRNTKSAQDLIREAPSGLREIRIARTTTTKTEEDGDAAPTTAHDTNTSAPPSPAPSPSKNKMMIKIDIDTAGSFPVPPRPAPAPLKFLKPAGVDDPSDDVARRDGSRPAQPQQREVNNADSNRETRRRQNLKRERDDPPPHEPSTTTTTTAGARTADRKKRKKSGAAATAAP